MTTSSPLIFTRAGVNPQSMDPAVSGDTVIQAQNRQGQRLWGVIDGAWVKGYENPEIVPDIAHWASRTFGDLLCAQMQDGGPLSLADKIAATLPLYRQRVDDLRRQVGYAVTPPAPFDSIDLAKIGPQSAFAVAQENPDGSLEIAQVRDCLAVIEWPDGRMERQTPNQSETVQTATRIMDHQHEGLAAYQFLAQEIILNDQWENRHTAITAMARKAHKPAFFDLWQQAAATLPLTLSGPAGFARWRETFDTLCLCQNSAYFLNNPTAETVVVKGQRLQATWAMMTGEAAMPPLMFTQTIPPDVAQNIAALWLMSDGAFKQGDRGADLKAMQTYGAEAYYQRVLLPRFNNNTPQSRRYTPPDSPDPRVPMDVSILRLPLR